MIIELVQEEQMPKKRPCCSAVSALAWMLRQEKVASRLS